MNKINQKTIKTIDLKQKPKVSDSSTTRSERFFIPDGCNISFPSDYEPNSISFGLYSKGKLSLRSYFFQFERNPESLSLSLNFLQLEAAISGN